MPVNVGEITSLIKLDANKVDEQPLPLRIPRSKWKEAMRALGIEAKGIRQVTISAYGVQIERFVLDDGCKIVVKGPSPHLAMATTEIPFVDNE